MGAVFCFRTLTIIFCFSCFFHGHSCPLVSEQWYVNKKHPFFPNLTFGEVHERTLTLDEQLRHHGNLTVLYECELDKQLAADQSMMDFFNVYTTTTKEPLSPRYDRNIVN